VPGERLSHSARTATPKLEQCAWGLLTPFSRRKARRQSAAPRAASGVALRAQQAVRWKSFIATRSASESGTAVGWAWSVSIHVL